MPRAWSAERERQYEHIRQSEKQEARSSKRAKEIAARTVNKQRAQSGETRSSRGGGSSRRTKEQRTALQRGEAARDRRPLAHEQGAAAAGRGPQEVRPVGRSVDRAPLAILAR